MKSSIITIRPFTPADANAIFTYASQPEIARYTMMPRPYTLKHAKDFIVHTKKAMKLGTTYEFGIELNETGEIIGGIGFTKVDKDQKDAEIGYVLSKYHWSKGIMSEAIPLILEYGFKTLKLHRIHGLVFEKNTASQHLLLKSGFTHEGTERKARKQNGKWMDVYMYGLLNNEWKTKYAK